MKITRLADIDPLVFTNAVADAMTQFSTRPVSAEARNVIVATTPQVLLDHLFDTMRTPFFELPINGEPVKLRDERIFDGPVAGSA